MNIVNVNDNDACNGSNNDDDEGTDANNATDMMLIILPLWC